MNGIGKVAIVAVMLRFGSAIIITATPAQSAGLETVEKHKKRMKAISDNFKIIKAFAKKVKVRQTKLPRVPLKSVY